MVIATDVLAGPASARARAKDRVAGGPMTTHYMYICFFFTGIGGPAMLWPVKHLARLIRGTQGWAECQPAIWRLVDRRADPFVRLQLLSRQKSEALHAARSCCCLSPLQYQIQVCHSTGCV
jgi:hypothetical protein